MPTSDEVARAAGNRSAALARILAEPRSATARPPGVLHPGVRRWAPMLVATAVVGLLVVAVLVAAPGRDGTAHAATPALLSYRPAATTDPAVLLEQLAVRAAAQPPLAGRFDYVHVQGWYLDVQVSGYATSGQVNPRKRELWVAADGSGRVTGDDETYDFGPGEIAGPQPVSSDPAVLERELAPNRPGAGTADWLTAAGDLWLRQAVDPGVQSALLRVLATKPDLVVLGSVTDRAGREGVAIGTTSDHSGLATDYVLILDPDTGALLGFEQVVLEAGLLPVQPPATISYALWLGSGRVDTTDERPAG